VTLLEKLAAEKAALIKQSAELGTLQAEIAKRVEAYEAALWAEYTGPDEWDIADAIKAVDAKIAKQEHAEALAFISKNGGSVRVIRDYWDAEGTRHRAGEVFVVTAEIGADLMVNGVVGRV
jgi:hypothetical protein